MFWYFLPIFNFVSWYFGEVTGSPEVEFLHRAAAVWSKIKKTVSCNNEFTVCRILYIQLSESQICDVVQKYIWGMIKKDPPYFFAQFCYCLVMYWNAIWPWTIVRTCDCLIVCNTSQSLPDKLSQSHVFFCVHHYCVFIWNSRTNWAKNLHQILCKT